MNLLEKCDLVNNRLAILEVKLDTKSGFVETFAIGVVYGIQVIFFLLYFFHSKTT
jgi:hypothetical protein